MAAEAMAAISVSGAAPVHPAIALRGGEATCGPSGLCGSQVSFSPRRTRVVQAAYGHGVPTRVHLRWGLKTIHPDVRLLRGTWRREERHGQTTKKICASAAEAVPETAMAVASVAKLLPPQFGFVVLTAAASAVLLQWQAVMVVLQRKKLGIKYPVLYEDKEDSVFNCYQRAHANTLESYPQFLALLLLSGVAYPVAASVCGTVWVVGRIFYSLGYYTGDPAKRIRGAWNIFGLLGLLILAGTFGVKQVMTML